jgi:hypothetical protein
MTHPTDRVRLPKRSRSEEATEQLDTAAVWLAEIDQVLDESNPEVLIELGEPSDGPSSAGQIAPRQAGGLKTD